MMNVIHLSLIYGEIKIHYLVFILNGFYYKKNKTAIAQFFKYACAHTHSEIQNTQWSLPSLAKHCVCVCVFTQWSQHLN